MHEVQLTHLAREDLRQIKRHIAVVLGNPSAANKTLQGLVRQFRMLSRFPEMGTMLLLEESPVAYRYVVYGNYMAFYHTQEDSVIVDRVLYGRSDYLRLLLGNQCEE